jgi:hypothetical protein
MDRERYARAASARSRWQMESTTVAVILISARSSIESKKNTVVNNVSAMPRGSGTGSARELGRGTRIPLINDKRIVDSNPHPLFR